MSIDDCKSKVKFDVVVMNSSRFVGKVSLVTGGSSGIGKEIVSQLVREGSNVVFCSNNEQEGTTLEETLNKEPGNHGDAKFILYTADSEDSIKTVVSATVEKFGQLDCLVNNVGHHPPPQTVDETKSEDLRKLFDINFFSYFLTSKYALPHLRKVKGSIVNVASIVATMAQKAAAGYCASKGAVLSMTKAMAIDEAPHWVRINCISPGNIWTPLWETLANLEPNPEAEIKLGKTQQVLARFGTPEDCAKTCLFLLSNEASFLTGVDIPVTGGTELDYGVKAQVN